MRSDHIAAHLWLHNNSSGDAGVMQLVDSPRGHVTIEALDLLDSDLHGAGATRLTRRCYVLM